VALDPATGEALWTVPRNAGELIPPALAAEGRSQGVAVYVEGLAADSGLVAVDLATRERLWRVRMGNRSRSAPTIANGAVFVGSRDRHLYAVDLATGEVRWRARTDGAVDTSPAVSEGRVFVVAENGSSGMATLYGFDADSGRRAWPPFAAEGLSIGASSPAVGDGTVYVGFGDLQVRAFDAATGRLRWATGVGSDFSSMSAPALADGDLFIAARSGGLFRLDGRSGEPEWVFQFPSPVMWGSPLVVGESVFVGLQDGTLAAVEVGTGHRMWRRVLVGGAVGPLAPAGGMLLSSLLGRGGGMVALDHDPRGVTGDVPSPTELRPGLAVANFAAAFGAVLVGAMLLGRLAFRRAGQGAEAVGLRPTEPGGTE
jgi:outer membrane protein assembly factor BamB